MRSPGKVTNQLRVRKDFTLGHQGGYPRCLRLTMYFKGDRRHHIIQTNLSISTAKKDKQQIMKSTALSWQESEKNVEIRERRVTCESLSSPGQASLVRFFYIFIFLHIHSISPQVLRVWGLDNNLLRREMKGCSGVG